MLTGDDLYCKPPFQRVRKAWDATTLGAAVCFRKFDLEIQQGWTGFSDLDIRFGQAYHSGAEALDRAFVAGKTQDEGTREAVEAALEVFCRGPVDPARPWETAGRWRRMGDPNDPTFCNNYKNPVTLQRAMFWYAEDNWPGPVKPVKLPEGLFLPGMMAAAGSAAVEVSFRIPLPIRAPDGEPYILCGHLDGIGLFGGASWVRERKTTASSFGANYWKRWAPNVQVNTYDLAGALLLKGEKWLPPLAGVLMEACQVGVTFARWERRGINRTDGLREQFLGEVCTIIKDAEARATAAEAGSGKVAGLRVGPEGRWPANSRVCSLYGGCHFAPVCTRDPSKHQEALMAAYRQKAPWNPLTVRKEGD